MDDVEITCLSLLGDGGTYDDVLTILRQHGYSKIQSIIAVVNMTGMKLPVAKDLVHNSRAWTDVYERDERFHDMLERITEDSEQDSD